jgi:predicted ATPase
MFFTVLPRGSSPPLTPNSAYLVADDWDDWFKYNTLYSMSYIDAAGALQRIGGVKIGQFGMTTGQRRPALDEQFDELDDRFFSLGQDEEYYGNLNNLGDSTRNQVLVRLRDVAFYPELFDRALREDVTGESLLRYVTPASVTGQFGRLARGGAKLSEYEFKYVAPAAPNSESVSFGFSVLPGSEPPTNVHVLIGRNGVGKTHLLNLMTRALIEENSSAADVGQFSWPSGKTMESLFANLVSVTFSAFDPFEPLSNRQNKATGVQYAYVGLKQIEKTESGKSLSKSPASLSREFGTSVRACLQGARLGRWRAALQTLETDAIFRDADVAGLAKDERDESDSRGKAVELFGKLSSGHKIVLLTITRLVETVEERTLVLLDEPEAHLHPPLLSAFVRSLSDLLINRNGVAIIATHSPVVLQEVPRSCAWKIRRSGREVIAERPEVETFGENLGVLTREVFGLEVTHSGFHRMLQNTVNTNVSFESAVRKFQGQLGAEAKAILRSMIASRSESEES